MHAAPERLYSSFIGGSMLSSLSTMCWMSKVCFHSRIYTHTPAHIHLPAHVHTPRAHKSDMLFSICTRAFSHTARAGLHSRHGYNVHKKKQQKKTHTSVWIHIPAFILILNFSLHKEDTHACPLMFLSFIFSFFFFRLL